MMWSLRPFIVVIFLLCISAISRATSEAKWKETQNLMPTNLHARHLTQVFDSTMFPYGNCRRNTRSPYIMDFIASTKLSSSRMQHCFEVTYHPCSTFCCEKLAKDFWKIELETQLKCAHKVQEFSLNGATEDFLKVTNNPTAVFRVTQLKLDNQTAEGLKYCFISEDDCMELKDLCATGTSQCRLSIDNNPANLPENRCCPVQLVGPAPTHPPNPSPSPHPSLSPRPSPSPIPPPFCHVQFDCLDDYRCTEGDTVRATRVCIHDPDLTLRPVSFICHTGTVFITANDGKNCTVTRKVNIIAKPGVPSPSPSPSPSTCHPLHLPFLREYRCIQFDMLSTRVLCPHCPQNILLSPHDFKCVTSDLIVTARDQDGCSERYTVKLIAGGHPDLSPPPPHPEGCFISLNCVHSHVCFQDRSLTVPASRLCPFCDRNIVLSPSSVPCRTGLVTLTGKNSANCTGTCRVQLVQGRSDNSKPVPSCHPLNLQWVSEYNCFLNDVVKAEDICHNCANKFVVSPQSVPCLTRNVTFTVRDTVTNCTECRTVSIVAGRRTCGMDLTCFPDHLCWEDSIVEVKRVCDTCNQGISISPQNFKCKTGKVTLTARDDQNCVEDFHVQVTAIRPVPVYPPGYVDADLHEETIDQPSLPPTPTCVGLDVAFVRGYRCSVGDEVHVSQLCDDCFLDYTITPETFECQSGSVTLTVYDGNQDCIVEETIEINAGCEPAVGLRTPPGVFAAQGSTVDLSNRTSAVGPPNAVIQLQGLTALADFTHRSFFEMTVTATVRDMADVPGCTAEQKVPVYERQLCNPNAQILYPMAVCGGTEECGVNGRCPLQCCPTGYGCARLGGSSAAWVCVDMEDPVVPTHPGRLPGGWVCAFYDQSTSGNGLRNFMAVKLNSTTGEPQALALNGRDPLTFPTMDTCRAGVHRVQQGIHLVNCPVPGGHLTTHWCQVFKRPGWYE